MAYSDKVIDHYENPRNVGSMNKNDKDVGTGMVGAPSDGTISAAKLSSTFYAENPKTYSDITISSASNGMAAGPITITGTLTIPSGSTFTVV